MNFLATERQILERLFPGLIDAVARIDFAQREFPDSPIIELYRRFGGPRLLVPKAYGGIGASPIEAVAAHRMLGAISPSLALGVTMHDFTVAFLAEYSFYGDATKRYLREIGNDSLILASGFAEGKSGANILDPMMKAVPGKSGYLVSGTKKPCTLADSMDYLTASVRMYDADGQPGQRGIAIIPARVAGIERKPFWKVATLAGAQSQEVVLNEVFVPAEDIFQPNADVPLDAVEAGGFLWFELLLTASYLGVASGLVERVYRLERHTAEERTRLLTEVETGAAALRGIAYEMQSYADSTQMGEAILANLLLVRYGIQQQISRIAYHAAELLGGMHFIGDPELGYTLSACAALSFHAPSRLSVSPVIDTYMKGGPLQMV